MARSAWRPDDRWGLGERSPSRTGAVQVSLSELERSIGEPAERRGLTPTGGRSHRVAADGESGEGPQTMRRVRPAVPRPAQAAAGNSGSAVLVSAHPDPVDDVLIGPR